jgi:iron(III) transport system substrate-binding protein
MKHSRMLLRVLVATLFFVQFAAQRLGAQDADTLQKAKAEGAVVFYTSAGLTEMKPLVDGFAKKFPFIKVELYRSISEKLLNKILTEERAQTHRFDVVLTNTLELEDLIARGLIGKYKSRERNGYSDKDMDKDGYWTNVQSSYYVLGYNTKLVPAGSVPKDWPDLLKPLGKKNFAMDREEYNWYGAMLEYLGQEPGRRFMRQLAALNPVFYKGHTLIAQLLAAGEFSLAIVYPHRVESMKKQGAPIDWVPTIKPIIAEMGPVGIAAKAPNPNSAKVLVDFILSREGQQLLRAAGRIVPRRDVPPLAAAFEASKLELFPLSGTVLRRRNDIAKEFDETFSTR